MSSDSSLASQVTATASSRNVALSPWVNEPLPAWDELLSAHDVARLTRRPRWVLLSLMALRRFPRKHRFHGRAIGWLRNDVLEWMAKDLRVAGCQAAPQLRRRPARQMGLPLQSTGLCAARRSRFPFARRELRQ